jgi:hypothetical protein
MVLSPGPLLRPGTGALRLRNPIGLEGEFIDRTVLRVPPSASYEAWEVSLEGGAMLVSQPGGTVAVWGSTRTEQTHFTDDSASHNLLVEQLGELASEVAEQTMRPSGLKLMDRLFAT